MPATHKPVNRPKIVCTLGPASHERPVIEEMIRRGMNVARLSCSHGSWEEREARIRTVRDAAREMDVPVGVLLDIAGPKFRLGEIEGDSIPVSEGEMVRFSLEPRPGAVPFPLPVLLQAAEPGDRLLIGDGKVGLEVTGKDAAGMDARVCDEGGIGSRQGVTLAEKDLPVGAVTERDEADLRRGAEVGVDWVAVSFVREAEELRKARRILREAGSDASVMAKIETRAAVRNVAELVAEADGVMVARGDLGLQVPISEIPHIQKRIVRCCLNAGKPVIIATQMLESMIENERPTRAEVTDVANAILDGADAVMLSGETAVGRHPALVVGVMAEIADRAGRERIAGAERDPGEDSTSAVARAACGLAEALPNAALLCCTDSGATARMVSRCRPQAPIFAVTPRTSTLGKLTLVWGVRPFVVEFSSSVDGMVRNALAPVVRKGYLRPGDRVVITAGVPPGTSGHTNLIMIEEVDEQDARAE